MLLDREPPGAPCTAGAAEARATVRWARSDAHTVSLASEGAAGYVVVLEGHAPALEAESAGVRIPLLRANERYWAIPTAGGPMEITVRYRPRLARSGPCVARRGHRRSAHPLALAAVTLDRSSSDLLASTD